MSAVVGVWLIIGGLGLRAGLRFYRHIKTKQYLDPFTMFPGGFYQSMNRRQALLILGLREPIDPKSIRNKHRLLMMNNHPDNGGSTYLATKINEAKDILLKAITAKAWILIDVKQGTTLRGKNTKEQYEVASLTKMYTFYSCLCLNETLRINPYQTVIKTFSTNVSGTSANLLPQRYIRLLDLYYALMLPSGNDAACLLACYYGFWLTSKPQGPAKIFLKQPISDKIKHYDLYFKKFVQYMNQMVKEFNHPLTHFENPHGLGNKSQFSTASELGEACLRFIKNSLFYAVCGCRNYKGCYYESQEGFQWQNTNILLGEGYKGIKTGFTTNAGGCLSSLLEIQPMKYKKYQFLVVVLGSSDAASRFADTKTIVSDFVKYLKMMKL